MPAVRVIIGDDDLLAREGIARLLEHSQAVEVVGSYADMDEVREAIERDSPDVVLADIRMPPSGTDEGIRLAVELRDSHPDIGVVVLSAYVDPAYAVGLFEHGSAGRAYLLKDRLRDADELTRAVVEVANGGALVDPRVVDELLNARETALDGLTPREREVLALIAAGRSNNGIADALTITTRAVERHVNAIFAKLDLREARDDHRRVRAALMYLAAPTNS